jgi:uncharacterized protein YgiM (DUF1202 family)
MFAPPSLVASLALMSPQLRALPDAMRRRLAQAGDVPGPGRYVVTGAPSGLNVRVSGSTSAQSLGTVPNGSVGTSDGTVDNGFAYMQWDNGKSGWSSVAYLAPEANAPVAAVPAAVSVAPAPAPMGPDLTPGSYVVNTATDPLNLRASPSTAAPVVGTIPRGATVQASGMNQNYFAQVQYEGKTGWAAAAFLTPSGAVVQTAGGGLILSTADLLQLRAMLAAWSNATAGAPSYGSVSDLALTDPAMARQAEVLAAFQKWSNANKGTNLRTDGIVDGATRDALVSWGAQAVGAAPADPASGAPTLPPAQPIATDGGGGGGGPSTTQAAAGGVAMLLGLGLLAVFFLVEEKKKRRGAMAAA